jgi:copper chaperone
MEIFVFKTNLKFKKHVRHLTPLLDELPGMIRWNVDLQDSDKVLRVVAREVSPVTVVNAVRTAGYRCEELPD